MNNRFLWLDATRGLAAIIVLAAHTADHFWRGYADFIQVGNAGVVLFFLCSGYVIPISLESLSLRDFWVRRFARLFPLYWLSIALFLTIGMSDTTNLRDVVANLTMLQSYLGAPHINAIFWSLTVELTFYAFMSALKAARLLARTFEVFLVLTIALSALRLVSPAVANTLVYLPVCTMGALMYRFDQGQCSVRELIGGLALLAVYLCTWPAPVAFILGWLIAIGLFMAIHAHRDSFRPAALIWCGRVSYSIYLLHGIPLWLIGGWGFPLIFPVAAVSYAVIEAPAIGLGQRLTRAVGQVAATPQHRIAG
jgi:peptidoglycan/LPS O-acetylase OafA/YrhL